MRFLITLFSQQKTCLLNRDIFTDMFLKHPKLKDLRILRIYSKSIETQYHYGPHSSKVHMMMMTIMVALYYLISLGIQ